MKRDRTAIYIAGGLLLVLCLLAVATNRSRTQLVANVPTAEWADRTPMGGRGLALLLQRLNYPVQRVNAPLATMPAVARVWLLLDPRTTFSLEEGRRLAQWVKNGGTLIWAASPALYGSAVGGRGGVEELTNPNDDAADEAVRDGLKYLQNEFQVATENSMETLTQSQRDEVLPTLSPFDIEAVSAYWSGVKKIESLNSVVTVKRLFLEIAGTSLGTQVARIPYGQGEVFVTPDAMLFTNYALDKPDNAVFVTNLIRLSQTPGSTVYFDERRFRPGTEATEETLFSAIWKSPARYALLQLAVAALLVWALYGRRLGAPVPLPESGPVTRASQFALAMGGLFHKVGRPRAAGLILGEEFRRSLTRRLGLSVADPDTEIARRAAEASDLPAEMIERLLQLARTPAEHEADALTTAQQMEYVLRRLKRS